MKVVLLSPYLFCLRRGVEQFTVNMANYLSRAGIDVHILTWKGKDGSAWDEMEKDITVHSVRLPIYLEEFLAGIWYGWMLKRLKPDVVYLMFAWHGEEIALFLNPSYYKRTLLFLHSPADEIPHRYDQLRKGRLIKKIHHLVAVSHYVAESAYQFLGRRPVVIENAVEIDRFTLPMQEIKDKVREKMGIEPLSKVLLFVGAFEKRKGLQFVLEAIPDIVQRIPNLNFLIAGDGPEKENLVRLTESLNIQKHVRFLGVIRDVLPLYHSADVFIFLSKGEATGLVVLEAMASGLPMVLSPYPPMQEIAPGEGAFFVDPRNTIEIAERVSDLLLYPEKRFVMGRINREFVEKRFSWKLIIKKHLELLKKCSLSN